MRKFAMAMIVFLVTTFSVPAAADETIPPDSQAEFNWATPTNADADSDRSKLWWSILFTGGITPDTLPWFAKSKLGFPVGFCSQIDASCINAEHSTGAGMGLFQLCSVAQVAPCLETLEFQKPSGEWSFAELIREANLTPTGSQLLTDLKGSYPDRTKLDSQTKWGWDSNPALGLPASASGPLLFKFEGRPNASGDETYALQATFQISGALVDGKPLLREDDFNISIRPTKSLSCANAMPSVSTILAGTGGQPSWRGFSGGGCAGQSVYVAAADAGWAAGFAESFPIRLKVLLPENLGGWFQGRVESPAIEIKKVGSTTNQVTFIGSPTVVPITSKQLLIDDPASLQVINKTGDLATLKEQQAKGMTGPTGPIWTPQNGIGLFDVWSDKLGDKARGSSSLWSFSHFKSSQNCMGNRSELQGLVTTNAMVYQANTPTLQNGYLTYKVAGQHLDSDGEVFKGTYNFIMRSSVARCLYGFTSAPISGTVSVTSASGEKQVASTSVTEKGGWLKLSASGFTFSTPTISVKLTQRKPLVKKTTITCVSRKNAKLTKRVTAVAPKCPTGYKKK